MRTFEIFNAARRSHTPLAVLTYDEGSDEFHVSISRNAPTDSLPLMLALFAERGDYEVPDKWARRFVEERIAPQGRQNLGEILRANGLDFYDEVALLAVGEGRSSQDDCLMREIESPHVEYAFVGLHEESPSPSRGWCAALGPEIARLRKQAGMTQRDLAEKTGIDQAAISRIESGRANPTLNTLQALVEGVGFSLLMKIV